MKSTKSLMALVAMAMFAMSSCTQEEDFSVINDESSHDSNAIMFGTYLGKAPESRATTMDIEELKNSAGFGVFAYYTGAAEYGQSALPNFMYNQQVRWTGEGNGAAWTYSPIKYWPNSKSEKVSFFAYAPYVQTPDAAGTGIVGLSVNDKEGDPMLKFKMTDNVASQTDLLVAEPLLNCTKGNSDEKVQFRFQHALSRIGFKRVAMIDKTDPEGTGTHDPGNDQHAITLDGNTTITIKKVELSSDNFGLTGDLNLHTGEWSGVTTGQQTYKLEVGSGDGSGDLTNNTLTSANATTIAQLNNDDKYLMIMPQTKGLSSQEQEITVKVTVEYDVVTTDDNLAEKKVQYTNSVSKSFKFCFVQGKSYNLVLHIGLTSVKFDAEVEAWKDYTESGGNQENNDITVNIPQTNYVKLTLLTNSNGVVFHNYGSPSYTLSQEIEDWEESAEFTIPADLLYNMRDDFLGFSEEKDATTPTYTRAEIERGNCKVTVKKDEEHKTLYGVWNNADSDD